MILYYQREGCQKVIVLRIYCYYYKIKVGQIEYFVG